MLGIDPMLVPHPVRRLSDLPDQRMALPDYDPRSIPPLQETVITPTLVSMGTTPQGSFVIDIPPRQQSQFRQSFSAATASTLHLYWVNETHEIAETAFLDSRPIVWTPQADHPDRFFAALDLEPGEHTLTISGLF